MEMACTPRRTFSFLRFSKFKGYCYKFENDKFKKFYTYFSYTSASDEIKFEMKLNSNNDD